MRRGEWRVTGTTETGANHGCPSPDGRWSVCDWRGRDGDEDLFVDDLTRQSALPLRRGRVVIPGRQGLPCWSPDGRFVYFLDHQPGQTTGHLVRLPAATVCKTALTKLAATVAEPVCEVSVEGQRLSITSDGQLLVLQERDGAIYLLSVPEKTCRKLDLGALVDPDLKLPVTEPTDAWAGPGDDQVTFSGQTTTADGQVRRRIYCCRFDGSQLQALTPADNAPVPLYTFPETKKTALELAKEWALEEVHYEKQWRARWQQEE